VCSSTGSRRHCFVYSLAIKGFAPWTPIPDYKLAPRARHTPLTFVFTPYVKTCSWIEHWKELVNYRMLTSTDLQSREEVRRSTVWGWQGQGRRIGGIPHLPPKPFVGFVKNRSEIFGNPCPKYTQSLALYRAFDSCQDAPKCTDLNIRFEKN